MIRRNLDANGVAKQALYDYAPDVIYDNGQYRIYWCGGVAGDHILHAKASTPLGPFHAQNSNSPMSFDSVLKGSGARMPRPPGPNESHKKGIDRFFDGLHTCDPNVIKIGTTYYLYYGGGSADYSGFAGIGVATSSDGVNFTRSNHGRPIVSASLVNPSPPANIRGIIYGAGQPAVVQVGKWFYMSFTDTTGEPKSSSNPHTNYNNISGAGQYMIRAKDPLFKTNVEELVGPGEWRPRAAGSPRHSGRYAYLQAVSVDMAYDPKINKMLVFSHQSRAVASGTRQKTTLVYMFDLQFNNLGLQHGLDPIYFDGPFNDGPGIAKMGNHHVLPRSTCEEPQYMIFKSNTKDAPDGLTHLETVGYWELTASIGQFRLNPMLCQQSSRSLASSIPDGTLLRSPGLPLAMVKNGLRIQFRSQRLVDLLQISGSRQVSSAEYHAIPYGGSIQEGQPAIFTSGQPVAFTSDTGVKFPVNCAAAISANGSVPQLVSAAQYNILGTGPALRCR